VNLEALTSGGSDITLSVLGRKIVNKTVEIWWKFTGRLLQTKHELKILDLSLGLTVGLLV
jgi:hypothetical protein